MTVKSLILILMSGVLVNNYVLQKFLGICPFLGVSKKFDQASGMGIAVTFVMLCATAVTYPLQTFVLTPLKLEYLQTIVFILVIAALVQFVELVLKKFLPALHKSLGVYLPLITTNCAVLGVAINNVTDGYNFLSRCRSRLPLRHGALRRRALPYRELPVAEALPRSARDADRRRHRLPRLLRFCGHRGDDPEVTRELRMKGTIRWKS